MGDRGPFHPRLLGGQNALHGNGDGQQPVGGVGVARIYELDTLGEKMGAEVSANVAGVIALMRSTRIPA